MTGKTFPSAPKDCLPLNGWTLKHPNITESFYYKIDPPTDIEDAHVRMSCHNHAAEDFSIQIEMNDISRSLMPEDDVLPYQEEEFEEMENKRLKLLAGKRFHLTAARAYWYYGIKSDK